MASGGSAIRGSRVGAGPMGEQDHGYHAERVASRTGTRSATRPSATSRRTCPRTRSPRPSTARHAGLPAGRDKDNPPPLAKMEPYKTHLAYVKERRTDEEAEQLLERGAGAAPRPSREDPRRAAYAGSPARRGSSAVSTTAR